MIPTKTRRIITETLETYGRNIAMVSHENVAPSTLYVVGPDDAGGYVLHGSVRNINWSIDVRDNSLVPELYDDEASTWA